MNIDLANIDFVPGQGGGGGITPSTPEVEPLFNKQDGYLKYDLTSTGYSETWIGGGNFPTTYGARYVFNVGDEVYNFAPIESGGDGKIYKFNEEKYEFELISTANGNVPSKGLPMWKTPDGITRYGIGYTVDLQTGSFGEWQHSTDPDGNEVGNFYQVYLNSKDNVILGTNGRPYVVSYNSDRAFVWDYSTNDFTITVPVSGVPNANYFRHHCYFNGKYLCVFNSVMYEFVEHFDEQGELTSVSFEVVSEPYFPLTTEDGATVNAVYVYQLDNITVYLDLDRLTAYQLVDGVWTAIKEFTFDEVPGKANSTGCYFRNYLFGYGYSPLKSGMIPFFNFGSTGPTKEFYGWYDLDSDIKVINSEIKYLRSDVDGLSTDLKPRMDDLETRTSSLETRTSQSEENIVSLSDRVSALETNYGDALNITNQILE